MNRGSTALALALLAGATGCTSTHHVKTAELSRLDGFRARELTLEEKLRSLSGGSDPRRALRDVDGDVHHMDDDTKLVLFLDADEDREVAGRYSAIDVQEGRFVGYGVDPAGRISLPLAEVHHAGVRETDWLKTALLTGGIAATLVLTVGIVAIAAGGGGTDQDDKTTVPCGFHGCEASF